MKYQNARDVLPDELLTSVQESRAAIYTFP